MTNLVTALRWVARLDGLAAIILGIVLLTGSASSLRMHIITGFVMTLVLLLIALVGFFSKIRPALPIISVVFAVLLPYVGFIQLKLVPGAGLVTVQAMHVILGICAIGIVEAIGAKISRAVLA